MTRVGDLYDCKTVRIGVSTPVHAAWQAMRKALDATFEAHTGNSGMPLPAFYAHYLPGAEADMQRALDKVALTPQVTAVHAQFVLDDRDFLAIELSYRAPRRRAA